MLKFNGSNWEYVGQPGFTERKAEWTSIATSNGVLLSYKDVGNEKDVTYMKLKGSSWETIANDGWSVNSSFWFMRMGSVSHSTRFFEK